MFKSLALSALFASSLFISGCQKADDPQPSLPEAEVKMQRSTVYLSTSRYNNAQGYSQKTLQSTATLTTEAAAGF